MSDTDQIRAEAERLADVPAGMVRVGEWLAGECPDGGVRCVPTNPETRGILAALMMAIGDAWQESGAENNLTWGMQVPGVGFVDIVMQLRDHPTPSEQRDALKAEIARLREELAQPPPELIGRWMQNELADYAMVLEHCTTVYEHFSRGRISKPNTLPQEVIAIATGCESDETMEAMADATTELREELARVTDQRDRAILVVGAAQDLIAAWDAHDGETHSDDAFAAATEHLRAALAAGIACPASPA